MSTDAPSDAGRPQGALRALETLHGTLGLSTLGALVFVWQQWESARSQLDAAAADAAAAAATLDRLVAEVATLRQDVDGMREDIGQCRP